MTKLKEYTVNEIIKNINGIYFLPDIQREFRWDETQVVNLFDSLYKEYPIGTCLIWKRKLEEYNKAKYSFYSFIDKVQENDNSGKKLEKPATIMGNGKSLFGVLDGQQRLTSLYIAIKGGFQVWRGRGRHPKRTPSLRELYFQPSKEQFAFFDSESLEGKTGWYKVKDIFAAKSEKSFCEENCVTGWEKSRIIKLHKLLKQNKVVHLHEVSLDQTADDAVEIFTRLNSGGSPLKRTELLFAFAINNWAGGRSEIEDLLKEIHSQSKDYGCWDSIDRDFVLKACLYLSGKNTSLSVKSMMNIDFSDVRDKWETIATCIKDALELLNDKGYCSSTIKSINAILPIVYFRYIKNRDFSDDDKKNLNVLFLASQIKGLFKSSTDAVLTDMRHCMDKLKGKDFSFKDYAALYGEIVKDKNALQCDSSVIKKWVYGDETEEAFTKGEDTKLLLTSLYEDYDKERGSGNYYYEQDHLHPFSAFTDSLTEMGISHDEIERWKDKRNTIGNLHLYRDRYNKNKSKKPLREWKEEKAGRDFLCDPANEVINDSRYIQDDRPEKSPYDIKYFELFWEHRSELILNALKSILLIEEDG